MGVIEVTKNPFTGSLAVSPRRIAPIRREIRHIRRLITDDKNVPAKPKGLWCIKFHAVPPGSLPRHEESLSSR